MIFFCRIVCRFQNYAYLCNRNRETKIDAEIAQLVEHNLAKVGVASSNLVFRSINRWNQSGSVRYQLPKWRNGRRARFRCEWLTAVQVRVLFWALILKANFWHAGEMAELVDALLWGGSGNYAVWVRVSFSSRFAEIAQLVEHNLAKVGVASSSLVFRSSEEVDWKDSLPFLYPDRSVFTGFFLCSFFPHSAYFSFVELLLSVVMCKVAHSSLRSRLSIWTFV